MKSIEVGKIAGQLEINPVTTIRSATSRLHTPLPTEEKYSVRFRYGRKPNK